MLKPLKRYILTKDDGITLIELAVAVLILSLGTIAALRATDQSRIAIGGTEDRVLAQLVARNRAEQLQLAGANSTGTFPATVTMGGQNFVLTTMTKQTAAGLTEATIIAQSQRGPGATLVVYLTPRVNQ